MNSFNILSNDFMLPLFLLAAFIYVLVFFPETPTKQTNQTKQATQKTPAAQKVEFKAVEERIKEGSKIEEFYELIVQDQSLQSELDAISNRDSLVNYLVSISNGHGYHLTALDINNSIKEYTEVSQDDYVCLSIGCWRVSG